jgi:hypothetical protein
MYYVHKLLARAATVIRHVSGMVTRWAAGQAFRSFTRYKEQRRTALVDTLVKAAKYNEQVDAWVRQRRDELFAQQQAAHADYQAAVRKVGAQIDALREEQL